MVNVEFVEILTKVQGRMKQVNNIFKNFCIH